LAFGFKKRKIRKFIFSIFLLTFIVGFRTYPEIARWRVNTGTPKLWVRFCDRTTITNDDLPAGDPVKGQALNFDVLTQSVLTDYNNIVTSYLRLYDADTDSTFASSDSTNRIITVCYGDVQVGHNGSSSREARNGLMEKCHITLSKELKTSAKSFVMTFTHELGHCLGLDHPQDTNYSIMSYFRTINRLQPDDKMGITYLYATHPSYAEEAATFGLSCRGR